MNKKIVDKIMAVIYIIFATSTIVIAYISYHKGSIPSVYDNLSFISMGMLGLASGYCLHTLLFPEE